MPIDEKLQGVVDDAREVVAEIQDEHMECVMPYAQAIDKLARACQSWEDEAVREGKNANFWRSKTREMRMIQWLVGLAVLVLGAGIGWTLRVVL